MFFYFFSNPKVRAPSNFNIRCTRWRCSLIDQVLIFFLHSIIEINSTFIQYFSAHYWSSFNLNKMHLPCNYKLLYTLVPIIAHHLISIWCIYHVITNCNSVTTLRSDNRETGKDQASIKKTGKLIDVVFVKCVSIKLNIFKVLKYCLL